MPGYRVDLANAHSRLGKLYGDRRQFVDAKGAFQRALAIELRVVEEFPKRADYRAKLTTSQLELGHLLVNHGQYLVSRGQYQEAEALGREAEAAARVLVGKYPNNMEYRKYLGKSLIAIATAHVNRGDYQAALRFLSEPIRYLEDLRRAKRD